MEQTGRAATRWSMRLTHFRQRRLRLALDALEMRFVAKALGIELVDVLRAGWTRGEPAIFSLDLATAERLAVARRCGVHGAHGISGELLEAELLRRQRLQRRLLRRCRRHIDAGINRSAKLRCQLLVQLARIAAALGHDLRGEQAQDYAVLVGGPHRPVALEKRGAGALLAGKAAATGAESLDEPFEADWGLDQLAVQLAGDAGNHRA